MNEWTGSPGDDPARIPPGQVWVYRMGDSRETGHEVRHQHGLWACNGEAYGTADAIRAHVRSGTHDRPVPPQAGRPGGYCFQCLGPATWYGSILTVQHRPGCPLSTVQAPFPAMITNQRMSLAGRMLHDAVWRDLPRQPAPPPRQDNGIGVCAGCGSVPTMPGFLKGPPSQRLCPACDAKRIAPSPEIIQGICADCGTESFVTNCDGKLLCTYCDELRVLKSPGPLERHQRVPVLAMAGLLLMIAGAVAGFVISTPGWTLASVTSVLVGFRMFVGHKP